MGARFYGSTLVLLSNVVKMGGVLRVKASGLVLIAFLPAASWLAALLLK